MTPTPHSAASIKGSSLFVLSYSIGLSFAAPTSGSPPAPAKGRNPGKRPSSSRPDRELRLSEPAADRRPPNNIAVIPSVMLPSLCRLARRRKARFPVFHSCSFAFGRAENFGEQIGITPAPANVLGRRPMLRAAVSRFQRSPAGLVWPGRSWGAGLSPHRSTASA
jgi:hypothetical protein